MVATYRHAACCLHDLHDCCNLRLSQLRLTYLNASLGQIFADSCSFASLGLALNFEAESDRSSEVDEDVIHATS